jgi:large repetitive protein
MRPSTLPPTVYTNPQPNATPNLTVTPPVFYTGDAGVRNINLYPGYATSTVPMGNPLAPIYPSAIPVRRLFQVPDNTGTTSSSAPFASNAGDSGDPIINNQIPANLGSILTPVSGALPPYSITSGTTTYTFTFNNLVTTAASAFSLYPGLTQGGSLSITSPPSPAPTLPSALDLGGGPTTSGPSTSIDNRQHPYFRMEMLQRIMNLTTPRTHQYAVWITIGFFEVTRPGDLGMLGSANPALAFDILGPEVGAVTGKNVRYRGFYLIDRLQLTSFSPNTPGSYRPAVVYRNRIQ